MIAGYAEPRSVEELADDSGAPEIRAGLLAIAIFFLGFGGWAALAPLDAAVVAPAVVVVSGNRQTVQHRDGGVISRLGVSEGERVRRGQILIELGAPEVLSQERALFSQVVDLQMQRARLIAETQGANKVERPPEWAALSIEDKAVAEAAFERHEQQSAVAEGEASAASWSEYDARITGYRDEIAALGRQEDLLREELRGMRSLAKDQLVPLTRVRALERALAELQGRRAELTAQIAATQQDRTEALRTVEARLAELVPQLVGAREQVERTRLRAPADGTVVGLSAHTVGGVIRGGERIMDIVPTGRDLVVEAQVRPEDADALSTGQRTEVRISALGGRNLPMVHGSVSHVSADRFVDERTGHAYFLAQVSVPGAELERIAAAGGGRRVRAGMSAQIVVPLRKRTALQYLLEPLDRSLWRSFREA